MCADDEHGLSFLCQFLADLAARLLEEAGIPVLDVEVGGVRGRKLVFHTDDGNAWIRCL